MAKKLRAADVKVVTAKGEHVDGEIQKKHDNDQIDVIIEHQGKAMLITNCPKDPTGKKPDSWHIPAAPKAEEQTEPKQ